MLPDCFVAKVQHVEFEEISQIDTQLASSVKNDNIL